MSGRLDEEMRRPIEWGPMTEEARLRAMVDQLLEVARLYVAAFDADEAMTLPERLRLQTIEDIVADPDGWNPERET